MDERAAYIGFSAFLGIGPLRFKHLLDQFGLAEKAWQASFSELKNAGLGNVLVTKLDTFRKDFNPHTYETELAKQEIHILTRIDEEFPQSLLEISDPPIALFVKGKLPDQSKTWIGVVGTRKVTGYGRQITEMITKGLSSSGCVIVSGMARGVDGIAHRIALEMGTPTVAVLGCGVDIIYPPEHADLYGKIISSGNAILSEVAPGHTVLKGLFPARNRIISGLSRGVVVTEGAEDSGSLITARLAAEQGRDVFAVPGPITSYLSAGPTSLIKNGAKMVTNVTDILDELGVVARTNGNGQVKGETPEQQKIIDLLASGEVHFDVIARNSGMDAAELGTTLSLMELSGIIRNLGNGKYALV